MIRYLLCWLGFHQYVWRKNEKHPRCAYCGYVDRKNKSVRKDYKEM